MIKNYSHFSLLTALSKPKDISKQAAKLGYKEIGLCDTNLSGIVEFINGCKEAGIKPIIGRSFKYFTLISKNYLGYQNLLQYDRAAHISDDLPELSDSSGLICVIDNTLSQVIGGEDHEADAIVFAKQCQDLFGNLNVYWGLSQNADSSNEFHRQLSKKTKIPCVAFTESFYLNPSDQEDHKILLSIKYNHKLSELSKEIDTYKFINYNNYHLWSKQDNNHWSINELGSLRDICDEIEEYSIFRKPSLPNFECPNNLNPSEYLRQLCRDGWKKKILPKIDKELQSIYVDRIKYELDIVNSYPILSTYFLIAQDYINWEKQNGGVVGVGRGSSGGCLISYLTNITDIDPIKYNLIFERFYNAGRNTEDNISLPDIDTDFEKERREYIINYLREKYGQKRVAHIVTFGNLKGRQAIKDVLRVHDAASFEEVNLITKAIPDEASIADELEEMEESSIIRWALINNKKELDNWAYLTDENKIEGPLGLYFEQAIRLENTKRNQSKHASGIVIGDVDIDTICPTLYDNKNGEYLVGLEMNDAEKLSLSKFDILGVTTLSKFKMIQELVNV